MFRIPSTRGPCDILLFDSRPASGAAKWETLDWEPRSCFSDDGKSPSMPGITYQTSNGATNMTLLERLQDDMKTALKTGQKDRLSVIRMLISDVKNVDLAPKPTTPEQAVESYAKKLKKSVEEYEKLGK